MATDKSPPLPPLEPNAYLRWLHETFHGVTRPMTLVEWAFAMKLPVPEARKRLVHLAAWTRRRVRLKRLNVILPPAGER